MADIFELFMIICFGFSWPLNIIKAWKARTAKGSSIPFYYLIFFGYVFGIVSKTIKLLNGVSTPAYVWFFYILNTILTFSGIIVWYRNHALDKKAEAITIPNKL